METQHSYKHLHQYTLNATSPASWVCVCDRSIVQLRDLFSKCSVWEAVRTLLVQLQSIHGKPVAILFTHWNPPKMHRRKVVGEFVQKKCPIVCTVPHFSVDNSLSSFIECLSSLGDVILFRLQFQEKGFQIKKIFVQSKVEIGTTRVSARYTFIFEQSAQLLMGNFSLFAECVRRACVGHNYWKVSIIVVIANRSIAPPIATPYAPRYF